MTPDERQQLHEVRRILSGAYEVARAEDLDAVLAAARPELAALRRAARGATRRSWRRWFEARFQNPYVRLASVTLGAALIVLLVLSRNDAAMRGGNVYTYQEFTSGKSGTPLGTSASVFRGLE